MCLLALLACDKAETVTRTVNLHVLPDCTIPAGSSGFYVATGDYEPAFPNRSSLVVTDQPAAIDGVPSNAASLALQATPPDETQWLGVSLVPPSGDVDILLLPAASACPLVGSVGFDPAMVFEAVSPHTIVATGATVGNGLQPSFRVDLDTGHVAQIAAGSGIGTPRLGAATAILDGARAMVTGGIGGGIARSSAEIFDESTGVFEPAPISLQEARANHGAVTLASGDVLLAGGQNENGLLTATERVHFDGASWRGVEGTTASLVAPRANPFVLRLADGTVLVGGGTDAAGPVSLLEFFSADATTETNVPFHARAHEAYVALDGGGALYVAAPDATDTPDFRRAWFVPPGGSPQPIDSDVTAPLTDPKLFARAGGGALLWTGTAWLAFDPWTGFAPASPAPPTGPDPTAPIATPDPGLRAWVRSDGSVAVWRDDVRNTFATDATYLTSTSATAMLAPDDSSSPPAFDPVTGLDLKADRTVFVADARYLDVDVDVRATGAPPLVVLRGAGSEVVVGGASCPYPPTAGPTRVHVERRGAFVSYTLGWMLDHCATIAPDARISVGIRGGGAGTHALDFSVTRPDGVLH